MVTLASSRDGCLEVRLVWITNLKEICFMQLICPASQGGVESLPAKTAGVRREGPDVSLCQ